MDEMPNEAASSVCASVSTLPNTASAYRSDARSKIGPNMRHGGHHSAQKSTRARSAPVTTDAKFSDVSSTVDMVFLPILRAIPARRWLLSAYGYPHGYANPGCVALIPDPFPAPGWPRDGRRHQ